MVSNISNVNWQLECKDNTYDSWEKEELLMHKTKYVI